MGHHFGEEKGRGDDLSSLRGRAARVVQHGGVIFYFGGGGTVLRPEVEDRRKRTSWWTMSRSGDGFRVGPPGRLAGPGMMGPKAGCCLMLSG
jgi:hypothetical protein